MALWTKASLCVKSSLLEQSLPKTPSRLISLCHLWLFSLFLCAFCAFLWLKNPHNLRNQRLINDLRACKSLYNRKDTFTDVMSALQIRLFMQNKPNFRKSQMNVTKVLTKDYEKRTLGERGKNKPNSNPIQTQYKPNTNPIQTQFKPTSNPIQSQSKPKQTQSNPISTGPLTH